MKKLQVKVHLVDDPHAPYQLEIEDQGVAIMDFVTDMKDASEALLTAIAETKEALEGHEMPEMLKGDEFTFEYKYDILSLLEKYRDILTKSSVARISGMNRSLISQYLSATQPRELSTKQAKRIEESLHKLGRELLDVQLDY